MLLCCQSLEQNRLTKSKFNKFLVHFKTNLIQITFNPQTFQEKNNSKTLNMYIFIGFSSINEHVDILFKKVTK